MKNNFRFCLIVLIISSLIITGGCEENNESPQGTVKDIYIVGSDGPIPSYWKNGKFAPLPMNEESVAKSIVVKDNDVYIAGHESSGSFPIAMYWKNGKAVHLSDDHSVASAQSITVSDGEVFVSGSKNFAASYWRNGTLVQLTDGVDAMGYSIAVSEGDVHVAGYEWNGTHLVAMYWKNGIAIPLTDGTQHAEAYSIVVSGSDVYVAGYEIGSSRKMVAKYWKNGIAVPLSDGSKDEVATSIFLKGDDVYVAGYEYKTTTAGWGIAKYWKNGNAVILSNGASAFAYSIVVTDNTVYVVGSEQNGYNNYAAKLWENGKVKSLTDGSKGSGAYSIALVLN